MLAAHLIAWVPMAGIAVLNGAFREAVLAPRLSELGSHQASCLSGMLLFFAYTWLIHLKWPLRTARQAAIVGLAWLAFTVLFEFGFGRFVAGHSWGRLIEDYRLFSGRLWTLVLLGVGLLPSAVFRLRS